MPKGRRVFNPQTIDIEISALFRHPASNLIHNARSRVFILKPPVLYTAGTEVVTNISGTREIRKKIKKIILTRED